MIELVPNKNVVAVKPIEVLLLNIEQVAAALQVSRRTVENLIASGQLPSVPIGRSRRVFSDTLREFARTGVAEIKKANEETETA